VRAAFSYAMYFVGNKAWMHLRSSSERLPSRRSAYKGSTRNWKLIQR